MRKQLTIKNSLIFCYSILIAAGISCNNQKQSKKMAAEQPMLIKTIGNPRYGNVGCSLEDKAGNLWFGTTQNGLYKYDGKSFTQYLMADGLNSNHVSCLLEDKDGKIWIGTEAGLCIYDSNRFTQMQIPLPKNLPPNKNPNYLNAHWVYSMIQAKDGRLWFVTIDGIYIYDGKTFTPFEIKEAANGFLTSNDKVERVLEDKSGNIWFAGRTNGGVFRYDGKSVTRHALTVLFQDGPKPKAHSWGWPQLQDKNGDVWFSNWGGVYKYDGTSFTSFTKKDGMISTACIIEDRKGNTWFGGAGLIRYDGKTFHRFTAKDGLPDVGVWTLLEDKAGNIWVGTRETGLYLYDGKKFIAYSAYQAQAVAEK
ncbi:MAG: hypothetical protein EOO13_06075 [Chitinophagaceae bacterium]|nr:MAG: hypothetical protein EOO13_06075 [Chitinophagaceae bacterium]